MIGDSILIGITTSFVEDEQRLDSGYVRAVECAGATPVILPMVSDGDRMLPLLRKLDGLVVPGGPAVTIGMRGTLPPDIAEPSPVRVETDLFYLRYFLDSTRPVLGVCYGMQLLNAELGGTIYADVEKQRAGTDIHSSKRGAGDHPIRIAADSVLESLMGRTSTVNSRHIQAIDRVADGLLVAATAPDGVVEAIESGDGRLVGVQFHPELMDSAGAAALFSHLVARARHGARR